MKIIHLIYTHGVAGAEKYLLDLLPGLKEYGIDCEVICVCPAAHQNKVQDYCERLKICGITTQLIAAKRIDFLSVAKKVNSYCKANDIAVIHAHLFNSDIIAVATKLFFNKKLFLISTKHGYKETYFVDHADRIGKRQYDFYYFLTWFIIRKIDKNITISKAISDLYQTLGFTPKKMPYIHHGISVDKKIVKEVNVEYRKFTPQLVIAGRLAKIKGHTFLFDAMPEIIRQFPTVHLLILGEGDQSELLKEKAVLLNINKHVSFMGFQNNPYGYIQASDIIVLPSLFEPFGLVYIEAFALKIPVVAFDVQASNEIITHNETGILAAPKNSAALADAIITLLKNPEKRKQIVKNGYEKYLNYYNTARMIKDTADWYKTVI